MCCSDRAVATRAVRCGGSNGLELAVLAGVNADPTNQPGLSCGRVGRNLALHIAVLVGLVLQVITMTVPGVRNLLGLSAASGETVLAVILVIAAAFAGQHALTWAFRRTAIPRSIRSTRGLLA